MLAVIALVALGALIGWILSIALCESDWIAIGVNVVMGMIGISVGAVITPLVNIIDINHWILSASISANVVFLVHCLFHDRTRIAPHPRQS
jgi:hypothetical protein